MREIKFIGSHTLVPGIALPRSSKIVGIDLIPEKGKLAMVDYASLCSIAPQTLYEQYQRFFKSANARWIGKLAQSDRYFFAVQSRLSGKTCKVMYTLGTLHLDEVKAFRLTPKDKKLTIVSATLVSDLLEDMLRKQSEFTILL